MRVHHAVTQKAGYTFKEAVVINSTVWDSIYRVGLPGGDRRNRPAEITIIFTEWNHRCLLSSDCRRISKIYGLLKRNIEITGYGQDD